MAAARVSQFVFPRPESERAILQHGVLTLLKRTNAGERKWLDEDSDRPITAHGFRATFRTCAEEVATFPHAVGVLMEDDIAYNQDYWIAHHSC